jgi:multidrug efflux pump subunit AcrA (membrane-fusion protein)
MLEGIVKSNGRLEATEVDVAAKYPGRLATLTVDEGDEGTAGQVVATISSPETEAQLRAAQAQVLKAKQALAEAVALMRRGHQIDRQSTRAAQCAHSNGPLLTNLRRSDRLQMPELRAPDEYCSAAR